MFPRSSLTWCVAALLVAVVLNLAIVPVVQADIVLWGGDQATVNSYQFIVTLYDMSRAFIVSGGHVYSLSAWDSSNVDVSGGSVNDKLFARDSSIVHISGGFVTVLEAWDSSNVDISGGIVHQCLRAYNSSIVDISGGDVSQSLETYDSSIVHISGGDVYLLTATDSSIVDISGGSVDYLDAYNSSNLDISGGTMTSGWAKDSSIVDFSGGTMVVLNAEDSSIVDILGGSINHIGAHDSSIVDVSGGTVYGLNAQGSSIVDVSGGIVHSLNAEGSSTVTLNVKDFWLGTGLTLAGERLLGTGLLEGEWMDGTPRWAMNIGSDSGASIFISQVPEPGALVMLITGLVTLLAHTRRTMGRPDGAGANTRAVRER